MIIAVDAVGGDFYPEAPVAGSLEAVKADDNLKVMLCGPKDLIKKELDSHQYNSDQIIIHDAPQIIGMNESPAQAVKAKQNSSIVTALVLQKTGKCSAFVSAGNTGALLAASTFILGKLQGANRSTIAAIFPTVKGSRLLLDAGANLEMKDEMYLQFAQMGSIYAEEIMNINEPRIGLLNVGSEDEKGTEQLKNVFQQLSGLPNFIGNVEGNDIFTANADVFICNGLVGNLLLKLGESVPSALKTFIGSTVKKMKLSTDEVELVMNVLKTSTQEFNPETVGGVPFLGVDGVSLVGHGSSNVTAIKNMILSAAKCVESDLNEKITASLN